VSKQVLLSTYGSRGDVEPMVALAVQLRALGAQVRVCGPPDHEFAELLAGVDVPLVGFGTPWRSWARPPSTPEERYQRVTDFIAVQYDTVAAAVQGCDLLVATAMSQFVAQSVAEKHGIPHRYVTFAPSNLDALPTVDWGALFGAPVNAHRASIGLPHVEDLGAFMFSTSPWLAADPTLGPWQDTADLRVVRTGAWILPDQRPLPPEVEAFLAAGAPPVYVGFGSMRTVTEHSARAAIEAVRVHGRRVLLARGWAGLGLLDDRDDCFALGEVNQQALFGRVAAVVHHGGAGTTTTAAKAGAPQVVVPQVGDQYYWAGRVAALGIGAAHDGPSPTTESLSSALVTALSPETGVQAVAVAARVRTDGAAEAATLLLDTTCGEAPPAS
jgi:vancomycin aglycone glucosyltransferase